MSGESERKTLATEDESGDVIQKFIEENTLDEQRIEPYKGYKRYSDLFDNLTIPVGILTLIAVGIAHFIETEILGFEANSRLVVVDWGIGILFIMFFLMGLVAIIARWHSEISDEDIFYHELAAAFRTYRKDKENLPPVMDRIENALSYIGSGYYRRIDRNRLKDIKRYLNKIGEADDPSYISDEFHRTFPRFMKSISENVASPSESVFSRLAKDMDSAYTGETRLRSRFVKDIKRVVLFVFTGPELVFGLAIVIIGISVYSFNLELSLAVGIAGALFGGYTLYQSRT